MKYLLSITIIILFIGCYNASHRKSQSRPRESSRTENCTSNPLVDTFFANYKLSPEIALDSMYNTNVYLIKGTLEMDTLKRQLRQLLSQLGTYRGYDLITRNAVSEHYAIYSYILYYDRQPVRFNFIVYQPPGRQWHLQYFQFDTKLGDELEESSSVKFLQR